MTLGNTLVIGVLCGIVSIPFFRENNSVSKKDPEAKKIVTPITIDMQPFGDISSDKINYVFAELLKVYPNVKLKKSIPLPKFAFYEGRKRYRADTLINYLRQQTQEGHVTIGITNRDISTTNEKIKDWGVMGLGYCPGESCVVSTFRLSKQDIFVQLFKTSIHELGHTQGLGHCSVKTCFMRDAEGKNCTNEETEFCPKCRSHLIAKGWQF